MSKKPKKPATPDIEWGVCVECNALVAWPGRGVACDCCPTNGEIVPADDEGNPL